MKKVKIIALISAVVTALLLYFFLNSLNKTTVETQKVSVVVAIADIPADTAITEEMITVTQLPAEAVVGGALNSSFDAIGKIAKSAIYTGEQLLSSKLVTAGDSENDTLAYAIEPGMRAITIAVDSTTGLSSMLTPGDHIDLIGEFLVKVVDTNVSDTTQVSDEVSDLEVSYTVMVLENITVLAVDNVLSQSGTAEGGTIAYATITLQVTPEQAMTLSMAQYEGELRAILRSPLDEKETNQPSLTLDDVLLK